MKLQEGISYQNGKYVITSTKTDRDLISLNYSYIRNLFDINNIPVFYGFKVDAVAPEYEKFKRRFIKDFKYVSPNISTDSYVLLLKKAVAAFHQNFPVQTIDVIIYPKSSSRINEHLANFIKEKSGSSTVIPDTFLKQSLYDVEIDMEKVDRMAKSDEQKEEILDALGRMFERNEKSYGEDFKMKVFYPYQRQLIKNFLRFKDDVGQRILEKMRTGTVLIIDDVYTSGRSMEEMTNIMRNLGTQKIVGFVLLKN